MSCSLGSEDTHVPLSRRPRKLSPRSVLIFHATTALIAEAQDIARQLPWRPDFSADQQERYIDTQTAFIAKGLGSNIHQIAEGLALPLTRFRLSTRDDPWDGPLNIRLMSLLQIGSDGANEDEYLDLSLSLSPRLPAENGVESTALVRTFHTRLEVESTLVGFRHMDIAWKKRFLTVLREQGIKKELEKLFNESIQEYLDTTVSSREAEFRRDLNIPGSNRLLHLTASFTVDKVRRDTIPGSFVAPDSTAYQVITSYGGWHSEMGQQWCEIPDSWKYILDISPHEVSGEVLRPEIETPSAVFYTDLRKSSVHREPTRLRIRPSSTPSTDGSEVTITDLDFENSHASFQRPAAYVEAPPPLFRMARHPMTD